MLRKFLILLGLALFAAVRSTSATAQIYSTIEVGQASLSAYSTATATTLTPFETISFKAAFAPGTTPNVFVMTPEFGVDGGVGTGDDPCNIRIKNVTNTGFDAVCIEPYNENRISTSITFDYIAIEDGIVTIPTTTMGSSVTFESKCLDLDPDLHQKFQNTACDYCGLAAGSPAQVQGYRIINFDTAFPAAPALLTQLKSVANVVTDPFIVSGNPVAPIGEPEFIAVSARNVNNTSFQAAIERLEAASRDVGGGDTFLTADEEFCYLAVEQNGCQTLDLSGIDGSVGTVKFQAMRSGAVVRGHNSTNVANFAAGCFSATPVAVASLNSRNGDDGGIIRRSAINATGITLIADEDRVSNTERGHINEDSTTLAFGQVFTTPVTLNYVRISQFGKRLNFDWETSAESFHLGFHLWGETRDGWIQLNTDLIPGYGANTDQLKRYRKRLRLSREQYNEVSRYGISSVDTAGFEEFYGPFDVGEDYGEGDTSEPIDWAATRKQFERSMLAKGYTKVGERWRKLSKRGQRIFERRQQRIASNALDIQFQGSGMRQITGAQLLDVHPQWQGLKLSSLALTLNGRAVERRVLSDDARLSADDTVLLNVIEPQGRDALYIKDYTYRLQKDSSRVLEVPNYTATPSDTSEFTSLGYVERVLTEDKKYLAAITSGSPWYDAQLFTTSGEVSKVYNTSFDQLIDPELPASLQVDLFGSLDLPDDQPDHHVQVSVNGQLVLDEWFDGVVPLQSQVDLAPGLLQQDNNEVRVTVPGDTGLFADIVLVDNIVLSAPTKLTELTTTDFVSRDGAAGYLVELPETDLDKTVFAYSSKGGFSTVNTLEIDSGIAFSALPFVSSVINEAELRYAVVDVDEIEAAQLVEHANIDGKSAPLTAADLMIVAHPNFIDDALIDYIEYKRDIGLEVQLLDWLDLVAEFGFGNNTPNSLDNYLASLDADRQPSHLLIVGGHTYDYLNNLGQDAVNFIPAHYRKVGIFEYTQSDNVFADINDDNLPDMAVGRWPVRTASDLDAIIAKSINWQEMHSAETMSSDVLLIAQENDSRNLDFEGSLDGRVSSNLNRESGIANVERVYLSELSESGNSSPVTDARAAISEAINTGTRLVSFSGHASQAGWGFQGIVNTALVKELTNEGSPTVVMPLACYTTDYQGLSTNTLAHQWLFAGKQGAAAVHGATSLGQYRENGIVAERILQESNADVSLGQAIMRAKLRMSSRNETLDNWALLGDPTLPAP